MSAEHELLTDPGISSPASLEQQLDRFALDVGMMVLTGTTDAGHMRAALGAFDFRLDPVEVEMIENLAL